MALIAVAANFIDCFHKLESVFESNSLFSMESSSGSTGKLFAQISNGAPFDALLAADQFSVAQLVTNNHALENSRFTYAVGGLMLWSAGNELANLADHSLQEVLNSPTLNSLAIANPRLAPYGSAAEELIASTGINPNTRLIRGENISQTFQFAHSKNVSAALIAKAQALAMPDKVTGYSWPVDARLHPPIKQDAVQLRHGKNNLAAKHFLSFLNSSDGRDVIRQCGYSTSGDAL